MHQRRRRAVAATALARVYNCLRRSPSSLLPWLALPSRGGSDSRIRACLVWESERRRSEPRGAALPVDVASERRAEIWEIGEQPAAVAGAADVVGDGRR